MPVNPPSKCPAQIDKLIDSLAFITATCVASVDESPTFDTVKKEHLAFVDKCSKLLDTMPNSWAEVHTYILRISEEFVRFLKANEPLEE